MVERSRSMKGSVGRGTASGLAILLLALAATPSRAQEPEVIVLDPNRPLIQDPGTVPAPVGRTPVPAAERG